MGKLIDLNEYCIKKEDTKIEKDFDNNFTDILIELMNKIEERERETEGWLDE